MSVSRTQVVWTAGALLVAVCGISRAQVTGLPQSWTFDANAEGWTYVDDAFRSTADPANEDGSWQSAGVLDVQVGHHDSPTQATSGGWKMDLTLAADVTVAITFRYNLTVPVPFEPWEYAEVLLEVDGTLHGSGGNDYIDRMTGMTGAVDGTTGWKQFTTTVALTAAASPHTITIGCYNNESTATNETAVLEIDDVSFDDAATIVPSIVTITADDPDDGDMALSADDTLTIRFDVETNEPAAATKTQIDGLLDFGTKSLGAAYAGTWTDAKTLVITVTDASGGTLAAGDAVTLKQDGTDDLANKWDAAKVSTASGTVSGDWGFNPDTNPSLLCWWKLDDDDPATVVDSGVLGLDGTVNGASPVTDADRGPVYSFDGAAACITAADDYNDLLPIERVTVACWIKPSAIGTFQTIVSKRNTDAECTFAAELATTGTVGLRAYETSVGSTALDADVWTHVLFSRDIDAGYCRIYIDGQLDLELSATQRSPFGDKVPARIGCYSTDDGTTLDGWFNGSISDVRVYDMPLTDTQAQRVYTETAVAAVTVSIAAGQDAAEPSTDGSFDLTIEGTHTGFTLDFTVSGSATAGTDYTDVGTSLAIASGATSEVITIALLPDTDLEGPEDVTITLVDGTDYKAGSPGSATIKIIDDDSFNLLTPASGTQDRNPGADNDLTWEDASLGPVPGVTGYTLEIATDTGFSNVVHTEGLGVVETTTVTAGTLSYGETYWWRVSASDGTTSYVCNEAFTFETATFDLTAPADATKGVDPATAIDFAWDCSIAGIDHFVLEIATDALFASVVDTVDPTSSATGHSYDPSATLTYDTDYYWRLTADDGGVGTYTSPETFSFTTRDFELLLPADGDTTWEPSSPVDFSWESVLGATEYSFKIATDTGFANLVIPEVTGLGANSYQLAADTLGYSTTYYWTVTATDGTTTWTPATHFTLAPTEFQLLTPADGETGIDPTQDIAFTWEEVAIASSYTIQIATDDTFTTVVAEDTTSTPDYTLVPTDPLTLTFNTTYYWTVTATDGTDNFSPVAAFSFTTRQFALLTPADGSATDVDPDKVSIFTWEDVPGATGYTIKISRDDQFTSLVAPTPRDVTANTYSLPVTAPLDYTTPYWWRVSVDLPGGTEDCAQDFTFTTTQDTTPPEVVAETSSVSSVEVIFNEPLDPATVTAATVKLTGPGGEVNGQVTLASGDRKVVFRPDGDLSDSARYTLTILGTVEDANGIALGEDHTFTFTTADALVGLAIGEGCAPAGSAGAVWVVLALAAAATGRRRS